MAGKKPDYNVCVSERRESNGESQRYAHRVGAAWVGEKGQITLRIGVPLILTRDVDLVLFENKDEAF
ncbi:MAG TPA: hypothetical protein VKB38_13115 [Terracidiphilus sp.]|nr:hypothetical protein [Terracidiphilus sp.]